MHIQDHIAGSIPIPTQASPPPLHHSPGTPWTPRLQFGNSQLIFDLFLQTAIVHLGPACHPWPIFQYLKPWRMKHGKWLNPFLRASQVMRIPKTMVVSILTWPTFGWELGLSGYPTWPRKPLQSFFVPFWKQQKPSLHASSDKKNSEIPGIWHIGIWIKVASAHCAVNNFCG